MVYSSYLYTKKGWCTVPQLGSKKPGPLGYHACPRLYSCIIKSNKIPIYITVEHKLINSYSHICTVYITIWNNGQDLGTVLT